jgi:indolepyruvate decarboxylase
MAQRERTTVGTYLARRLEQLGPRHVFGVPGDYVLTFFDILERSDVAVVTTCNELNAGYAADAYARVAGLGAVCLTYGVGGFSVYNAVAGAYAERVPLVVISGGPKISLRGRLHPYLLHHTLGDMNLQRDIFGKVTQEATVLANPTQAPRLIDDALAACIKHSRPVYLELPADVVAAPCAAPGSFEADMALHVDDAVLREALDETMAAMERAGRPGVLAGVAASRLGARGALLDIISLTGFPIATTGLGRARSPRIRPDTRALISGRSPTRRPGKRWKGPTSSSVSARG